MKSICTILFSSMIVCSSFAQNVGIGITSPTEKLEVDGNLKLENSTKGVLLSTADAPMITRAWDAFTSGAFTGVGRWGLFMQPNRLTMGIPNIFGKHFSVAAFDENSTVSKDLFTVNWAGDVGVGTSFPVGKFQVYNDSSLLTVFQDGRIGINTDLPVAKFDIKASDNSTPFLVKSSDNSEIFKIRQLGLRHAIDIGGNYPGVYGVVNISNSFLGTLGNPHLRLTAVNPSGGGSLSGIVLDNTNSSSGRYTIRSFSGTDDSQHFLSIQHTTHANTAGTILYFNQSNNMGVGTNSPTQKLTVQGSINSSALSGTGVRNVQADASGTLIVAPVTKYMNVSAYAFRTISASTADALSYSGLGGHTAVNLTTGLGSLVAPVYLPHGAVVRNMKVNFIDNSSQNITVSLSYNVTTGPGGLLLGSYTTSGVSTALRSGTVSLSNVVVNNNEQSYYLVIHMTGFVPWEGTNTSIHSIVIEYE